jgi:hypothetical protein
MYMMVVYRHSTVTCAVIFFNDFNALDQSQQVYASTNEGFNEVWWFYCSANSTAVDRYVMYNYLENVLGITARWREQRG